MKIRVDVSPQSHRYLAMLVKFGIYGVDVSEVAARIIDKELQRLIEKPWTQRAASKRWRKR